MSRIEIITAVRKPQQLRRWTCYYLFDVVETIGGGGMVTEIIKARKSWRVIGASVRGAAHLSSGAPNRDAIHWLPEYGAGPPVILAVSDGRGSAKCIRSDVGSRLAVTRDYAATLATVVKNGLGPLSLSLTPKRSSFCSQNVWWEP